VKQTHRGFTLIELLVVISIIGLLSSIILASLSTARAKARDARRKTDVHQIVNALYLYRELKGDWMEAGSGCGRWGNGYGWFNSSNGADNYPQSMAQCLVDAGAASAIIIDPSGNKTSSFSSGNTYMKYTCTIDGKKHTLIYAKLEDVPPGGVYDPCGTGYASYGMNYYQEIVE